MRRRRRLLFVVGAVCHPEPAAATPRLVMLEQIRFAAEDPEGPLRACRVGWWYVVDTSTVVTIRYSPKPPPFPASSRGVLRRPPPRRLIIARIDIRGAAAAASG